MKALWQNENYAEILEYTATEFENDPVLLYFHVKALKQVRKIIFGLLIFQLNSKNLEMVLGAIEKCGKFSSDPFIIYWYGIFMSQTTVSNNFSKAHIFFERDEFLVSFAESAKIINNYPFFWDAWLLLIASVRHEDQVIYFSSIIIYI